MDVEAANAARCRGRKGTYEVWYLTISEPAKRQGYWIRYTTFNPAPGVETEAHSALWGFFFDHENPSANWGGKASFPLESQQLQSRPFVLRIDDAMLVRNGCSGLIESDRGRMSWDLRWDSREQPFPFMRSPWHVLSSVANIGVQPAIKVSGRIEVNGKTNYLEHAPGGQHHTWGTRHALEWNWGFASGDDFWVAGATSRVRSPLGLRLIGTPLATHARQQRFVFNDPLHVLGTRGPIAPESWTAQAKLGPRQLHVAVTPRPSDLIGVNLSDPRGGTRVVYHTEVADLEMRLTEDDEVLARVRRPASAAFEYASESPIPDLPVLI
jgi:hypothetical protein